MRGATEKLFQHDPGRRVIARAVLATDGAVDAGLGQARLAQAIMDAGRD
jgi:hypothetical protein